MRKSLLASTVVIGALYFGPIANASVLCAATDINLTINGTTYNPTSCATDVQTGANNPTAETTAMNTAFGGGLTFLAKDDGTSQTVNGIKYTVDTPTGTSWTVGWTDVNGAAAANLPLIVNFAALINGGNNGDAYLFTNVLLPAPPNNSGSGNFTITFQNVNGTNIPGLSHLTLAGTTVGSPPDPIPEPMTMALLGLGIVGLGAAKRYRN